MPKSSADPEESLQSELAQRVAKGDRRALARAITLVESTRPEDRAPAEALMAALPQSTGESLRIGIAGAPGVGKSTLVEVLGLHAIAQGHRLAVLAVDPSSPVSGGSILGDKTRMTELSKTSAAFIRPSPAAGRLGGVARRTAEAIRLCEAAGYDRILIETVGLGQSETAIAGLVDLVLLLVAPGGGDELQGIKRGIVETADILAVTKADGAMLELAGRTAAEYQHALRLIRPAADWAPIARTCSALTGAGIAELWEQFERFRMAAGPAGLAARRAEQAIGQFSAEIEEELRARLSQTGHAERLARLKTEVAEGRLTPRAAARALVSELSGPGKRSARKP
ncbi:MAG TPA: methylmalonyl Co-A mutase-associated GTPase MeaB [Alphaproteobacteria bacterium]|nr:methylmalonyl Co-A mutase-associated GTPase MeaB [Alphaproteobacteria bacterium]